jgi:hypothetical protein
LDGVDGSWGGLTFCIRMTVLDWGLHRGLTYTDPPPPPCSFGPKPPHSPNNNGPKEGKTAEVKAPERGEKSSIMDRLKSAKAEKQKECCPPKKHKGEIEL